MLPEAVSDLLRTPARSPLLVLLRLCITALQVISGSSYCQVTTSTGNTCVTDGYGNYGNNERCTIQVLQSGRLSTYGSFRTELGFDYVTIGSTRYQGTRGPGNVYVSYGSTFTWRSDSSVTDSGWTICWSSHAVPTPPPRPVPSPPPTRYPTLTRSGCRSAVDLMFLIDGSGSMSSYFQTELAFVTSVISYFHIGSQYTRVAAIL